MIKLHNFIIVPVKEKNRSTDNEYYVGELKVFLCSIQQMKLLSSEQTQETPPTGYHYHPSCLNQYGMSKKKVHEVKKMSEYIESLIVPLGIRQVSIHLIQV